MKTKFATHLTAKSGFSLFEVLTVLAIIGIVLGIAIPSLNARSAFEDARDRRNAQELCAVFTTAQAAGLDFGVPGNLQATVANVVRGGSPEGGIMKNRFFGLRGMQAQDIATASRFLRMDNGNLVVSATPSITNG